MMTLLHIQCDIVIFRKVRPLLQSRLIKLINVVFISGAYGRVQTPAIGIGLMFGYRVLVEAADTSHRYRPQIKWNDKYQKHEKYWHSVSKSGYWYRIEKKKKGTEHPSFCLFQSTCNLNLYFSTMARSWNMKNNDLRNHCPSLSSRNTICWTVLYFPHGGN